MALTPERRAMLDVLTDQQLRAHLANASPGPGSMVFMGSDIGMMLRGDVEDFLRERQEKAAEAERQRDEAQRQREQKTDKAQKRRDILQLTTRAACIRPLSFNEIVPILVALSSERGGPS
jgi:hypothetical protein